MDASLEKNMRQTNLGCVCSLSQRASAQWLHLLWLQISKGLNLAACLGRTHVCSSSHINVLMHLTHAKKCISRMPLVTMNILLWFSSKVQQWAHVSGSKQTEQLSGSTF